MAYTIDPHKRAEMQKLAQAASLPYTTILEQHLYDLKGLEQVLQSQMTQTPANTLVGSSNNTSSNTNLQQMADLPHQLKACQEEIAAYEQEQQQYQPK